MGLCRLSARVGTSPLPRHKVLAPSAAAAASAPNKRLVRVLFAHPSGKWDVDSRIPEIDGSPTEVVGPLVGCVVVGR